MMHRDIEGKEIRVGDYVEFIHQHYKDVAGKYHTVAGRVIDVTLPDSGGGGHWSYEEDGRMEPHERFVHIATEDGYYHAEQYGQFIRVLFPREED